MRSGTALIARGITRCGSCASPAVMPMISMPPKANTTTDSEATSPAQPLGRKPPCCHRLCTPVADVAAPSRLKPKNMMPSPARIIATMAPTLTSDSQNSSSPKTLTWQRFSPPMNSTMDSTQIQRGTSGNQNPM